MKNSSVQSKYVYVKVRPMDEVRVPRLVRARPVPNRKTSARVSPLIKTTSAFILALSLVLFVSRVGYTVSYFNDTERSDGNGLGAMSLDFTILPDGSVEAYIGAEAGGGKALIPVVSPVLGSSGLEYRVFAEKIGGNDTFCHAVNATATTSPFVYSGPLLSLVTSAATTTGSWPLALSLDGSSTGIVEGDTCMIDLVYRGWPFGASEGAGYQDEERVHLILHARMVVINEFLPNPEGVAFGFDFGTDASAKPQGEWVEFFNNSTTTIDLAGWYVWDASGLPANKVPVTALNTLPATTLVPPLGWLVVYLNEEILDNTSDEVRLYNASDVLVDTFAYDSHDACIHEPTPDLPNDPISSGGVCDTVPPNKSYARIPDGLGIRLDPIPTPGFANTDDPARAELAHEFLVPVVDENLASSTPEAVTEFPEMMTEIASTTATSSAETLTPPVSDGGGGGGGSSTAEEPTVTPETETEAAPDTSTESDAASTKSSPAAVSTETPAAVSEETPASTDASTTTEPPAETPAPEATTSEPASEEAPPVEETPASPMSEHEVPEATEPPAPAEVLEASAPAPEPTPAPEVTPEPPPEAAPAPASE